MQTENTTVRNIFIVDDHQMMVDGVKLMIEGNANYTVIGESTKPLEVLDALNKLAVDVLITDIDMPGMTGVELTRLVKNKLPHIKILALSMFSDSAIIVEMIDAGISGYILKNSGKKELIEALNKIVDGQNYFAQDITLQLTKSFKRHQDDIKLTDREIEIIRLIEQDLSTRDIADQLFISERTVETHRKNILSKTNTHTVVGLLKYAYERKII